MSTQQPYQDGWVGSEGKQLTVVPRARFPFANNPNPDTFSRAYERDWMVYPPLFVPLMARRTSWTNLVTYSEDLTNAAWTKVNGTAAANVTTAPDGNTTMGRLLETVTNAEHSVAHAATMTAVASEVSIFAAGGLTREWIKVSFTDSAATVFSAFFNVLRGYFVGASAGTTPRIIPLGAGFFRCVLEFTPAAGAGTLKINLSTDGSTISYAGTTTAGVYLWGAQANVGASSPYVSTTSATRTISVPDRDESDPFAFLVGEEDPQPNGSQYELVRRLFSRVPLTQVIPSFIRVNKPSVPSSLPAAVGNYVISQPDPAFASYNAYARQATLTDAGPSGIGGSATAGTFTISWQGSTTAPIAFDATAGVVQAALNAIASIVAVGGVTVSGDYLSGYSITFPALTLVVGNGASLTVGPSAGSVMVTYGGIGTPGSAFYTAAFLGSVNFQALPFITGQQITGGTYTLTLAGGTTSALAHDASAGTVLAALNAIPGVIARGGVVLAIGSSPPKYSSAQIQVTYAFQYPAFTVDASGLTPGATTATITKLDPFSVNGVSGFYGRQQLITFSTSVVGPRDITTGTPHGIVSTDRIYAKAGSTYYLLNEGQFTVPDAYTIQVDGDSGAVASTTELISEIGKLTRAGYAPGSLNVRCNRTQTFYLPGYTPGIATAGDIVPPVYQGDADTFLALILEGTATINYDVGELETWRGSILVQTVVTINASDL